MPVETIDPHTAVRRFRNVVDQVFIPAAKRGIDVSALAADLLARLHQEVSEREASDA